MQQCILQTEMAKPKFDERALELLKLPLIGYFAFIGLDGHPRVLPTWFELAGTDILVESPVNSYKARSLRANPLATLSVSTSDIPYRIATVKGHVEIEEIDFPARVEVMGRLARYYLGDERGQRYEREMRPGPGDLLRLRAREAKYEELLARLTVPGSPS